MTISARISHEDAEFLSQMKINGAETPSDKLRGLIAEARRRHNTSLDYAGSLQMLHELIFPIIQQVRQKEVDHQVHSEVISRLSEWVPDTLAFLISFFPQTKSQDDLQNLLQLEQGLVKRLFLLLEAFLQLAISSHCPCYEPDTIQKRIRPVLDLCGIIANRQQAQ
ncbi:MAG: hypothetical protein HKP58_12080 [Desulfatitalea sp.]|nr:hypothetical protein [Desulfatitalea sp.]